VRLHGYFRSSAAYRVRIALNLKKLPYEAVPVHLLRDGGEQNQPGFRALNPQGLVPVLEDDGHVLTQSLAILEYLEETHPEPPLLPADAAGRARVRALALQVACEIHPLNNLRVLRYLKRELGIDETARDRWYRHWIATGFEAFEASLSSDESGRFCHGDTPGLADVCLVPQLFNARRFDCDLSAYPRMLAVEAACVTLPAFAAAHPARQPDADPA
jgi:maleylacetoacetate isomerase